MRPALGGSASDDEGLHSFRWVCGHLRLDPVAVRNGLANMTEEKLWWARRLLHLNESDGAG
jgi:hypothetical protein